MNKCLSASEIVLPLLPSAGTARFIIDVDRTIGGLDPKIHGVFMEPILFSGRGMGLPDTADFHKKVKLFSSATVLPK
jgi:hypothetical protein